MGLLTTLAKSFSKLREAKLEWDEGEYKVEKKSGWGESKCRKLSKTEKNSVIFGKRC